MKPIVKIRVLSDMGLYMIGFVTGHPRWPDANHGPIATSAIVKRFKNGNFETLNTHYIRIKE